jgi:hypothetical protein
MGDRANFGFENHVNGNVVFLYGHWAGEHMLGKLAQAILAAENRWDDAGYATRIAICDLIGEDWNMETGWGLYVDEVVDNEHSVPVVNWPSRTVTLWSRDMTEKKFTMSLASFCEKFGRVLV